MVQNSDSEWLVGQPSRPAQFSALWMGSTGLLILGLQPILLGALFSDKRVSFDELALLATFEILAIGLGSVIAAFLFSTRNLKLKSAVLLLALAVLNGLTAYAGSPLMLTLWRTLAGFVEGGTVAISVELIARSRLPERFGGYFISLQTAMQCVVAVLLSQAIIPVSGSAGGFLALAAFCVASLPLAGTVPSEYGDVEKVETAGSTSAHVGLSVLCLLSIFCFALFIGSLWAFMEPLGGQYGIPADTVGLMVSASLLSQLIGAMLATWAERRLSHQVVLPVACVLAMLIAFAFHQQPGLMLFWICALATGFIWLFITPYQIGLSVEADENRKIALVVPAAQLFGAAIGPIGASMLLDGTDFRPVAVFAGGSALASLLLLAGFVVLAKSLKSAPNKG